MDTVCETRTYVYKQFEFLRNLSSNPSNTVIGIVRNVAETEAKIASWKSSNIHIIQGNLDDYESLEVLSPIPNSFQPTNT
jgi:hypothetical protein